MLDGDRLQTINRVAGILLAGLGGLMIVEVITKGGHF